MEESTEFAKEVLEILNSARMGFRRAIFVGPEYYERMRRDPYLSTHIGHYSFDPDRVALGDVEVIVVYPNSVKV